METSNRRFEPWQGPWQANAFDDLLRLENALHPLAKALEVLHERGLVWLTFDPREIEEVPAPSPAEVSTLRFMNLDLGVHAAGECPEWLHVPANYAAPEAARFKAVDIGPRTNVYHLGLYAYYWLSRLLPRGFTGNGLESFGFHMPPLRTFRPSLPPGIARVLHDALSIDPRRRFATPTVLCQALHEAIGRARTRYASTEPIRWEIGQHSRTGRTKEALKMGNEDYAITRHFSDPPRSLAAVADGITTCHVGSGALASWMIALVLENTFDAAAKRDAFPKLVRSACRKGAEMLLSWALEKGYKDQLLAGLDLMGTTLTAAWLEGRQLSLANVGDSRAYLIDADMIDQITVDGDVGSELLAGGVPPEEVRELGAMARALRVCIGGCTKDAAGELTILEDFCRPCLSFWPLVPGDVVVLCSDGLIEEGAFLEPEQMADIVRQHRDLPAEELALRLAEASDAMHRLPSTLEPDGFGDNITCLVIKIERAN
jgi:protein phosphatase